MVPDNVRHFFLIRSASTDCVLHRAHAVHTKYEYRRRYLSSFLFELAGLGLFFVFWIVGAGIATVCNQLPFLIAKLIVARQPSHSGGIYGSVISTKLVGYLPHWSPSPGWDLS
jgi:hypothetical protein